MTPRDSRSGSFADRSFIFAALVSVLWHLFWFFSVTIVVAPPRKKPLPPLKVVALGPVLADAIFKTLVDARPEISKAFYRQPADFSTATEVPEQSVERYAPGDVVSVPAGRKFESGLKNVVSGVKSQPDIVPPPELFPDVYFELSGPLDASQILSRPEGPPVGASQSGAPAEFEFSVRSDGGVADADVVLSSGDAAADLAWAAHLRQWIFSPEGALAAKGARMRVRFRPPERTA